MIVIPRLCGIQVRSQRGTLYPDQQVPASDWDSPSSPRPFGGVLKGVPKRDV